MNSLTVTFLVDLCHIIGLGAIYFMSGMQHASMQAMLNNKIKKK